MPYVAQLDGKLLRIQVEQLGPTKKSRSLSQMPLVDSQRFTGWLRAFLRCIQYPPSQSRIGRRLAMTLQQRCEAQVLSRAEAIAAQYGIHPRTLLRTLGYDRHQTTAG